MADIQKPDMSSVWASGGAILTPSTAKIETGWTAEIPPHQWENYVQNRQDSALAYLFQKGIPEWDATTEYQANKSFVQYAGVIYKAKTLNTNKQPNSNPSDWSDVIADAIAVIPKLEAKTFAEIDALSSDQGPIICSDMGGYLYTWQTSAYFTGYRNAQCGNIPQTMAASPRNWELAVDGGTWSMSNPKHKRVIAWFQEQGLTIASGSWAKGFGYIADLGGGNWKAPDLRDVFLRMAGTDADTANAAGAGAYKAHTLASHGHQVRYVSLPSGSAVYDVLRPDTSTSPVAADGAIGRSGTAETAPDHVRVGAFVLI